MKTKNTLITIVASILVLFFFSQKANAQINAGAGLVYGTEIENLGININGQYFIKENIAIAPSFTYYFPKETIGDFKLKWFEINADANYYFEVSNPKIKPYGLAGLSLSVVTVPGFNFGGFAQTEETSTSKLGVNIGGGVDFDIDKAIMPFAQIKYTLGDFDQLAIMAGVRYEFGK